MKKRLKGLLALSLVVVMVLAMSTGVASAATYSYSDSGDTKQAPYLQNGTVVFEGDIIRSTGSGGRSFSLANEDGSCVSTNGGTGEVHIEDPQNSGIYIEAGLKYIISSLGSTENFAVPKNEIGYFGYITKLGDFGTSFFTDTNGTLYSLYLEPRLTKYTIKYDANSGTGTIADEDFTVEQSYTVNDGSALKRDGYRFAGWNLERDGSGVAIPAGSNPYQIIELLNKAGRGTVPGDTNHLISVLYAQWTPLDNSPAAGDSFPTAPLLMLMLMSAGAAVAVKRRKA